MNRYLTPLLITALLGSLTGCNLSPESVPFTPNVSVIPSQVGQNHTIAVAVFNEVPSNQIGIRASNYDPDQAITLATNLQPEVQSIVFQTLKQQGFNPIHSDASRHLVVRITRLQYSYSDADSLGAKIHIHCSLSITANAEKQSLQRTYNSEMNFGVLTTPSQASDKANINSVISAALNQMMNDQQLIHLLSQ